MRFIITFVPSDPQADLVHRTVDLDAVSPRAGIDQIWSERWARWGQFGMESLIDIQHEVTR